MKIEGNKTFDIYIDELPKNAAMNSLAFIETKDIDYLKIETRIVNVYMFIDGDWKLIRDYYSFKNDEKLMERVLQEFGINNAD